MGGLSTYNKKNIDSTLVGYVPFGAFMTGRTYDRNIFPNSFNGKRDDNELGSWQDYGERMYDKWARRPVSIDPLFKKYPELSTYQFFSDRPIDGIDQDGLEYATFTIFIQNGKVSSIGVTKDYELKNKSTDGPGIKYNKAYLDKDGKLIKFEAGKTIPNDYGIYQGSKNPQLPEKGGDPNKVNDDYSLPPIDEEDANAKQHDVDYDGVGAKGIGGVLDKKTEKADADFVKRADKIIDKSKNGEKDAVTGKPISKDEKSAASRGKFFFNLMKNEKKTPEQRQKENKLQDNGPK